MQFLIVVLLVLILASINPAFKRSLIAICFFAAVAATVLFLETLR